MKELLLDTHTLFWHVTDYPKMPKSAVVRIEELDAVGGVKLVCTISLVELIYLAEKGKPPQEDVARIFAVFHRDELGFRLIPLDEHIARLMARVPRNLVPDMPDRIIAATALALGLELVTADERLRAFDGISTSW